MTDAEGSGLGGCHDRPPDREGNPVSERISHVVCCLCGSPKSAPYWSGFNRVTHDHLWHVVECSRCGLVYLNPGPPPGLLDDLRDRPFAGTFPSDGRPSISAQAFFAEWEARVLQRSVPRGSLLDVGCGEGELWRAATDAGWDAYGVDIHVSGVSAARAFWRTDRLFAGGIDQVPALFTRQFDVVNLSQVMEHLPDPIGALRRLTQVIRPGGLLTIDVPNLQSAAGWVDRRRVMDVPAHLHYWSRGTLRRALETSRYAAIGVTCGVGALRLLTRFVSPTAAGVMAGRVRRIGTWGGVLFAVAERSAQAEPTTVDRIERDA